MEGTIFKLLEKLVKNQYRLVLRILVPPQILVSLAISKNY